MTGLSLYTGARIMASNEQSFLDARQAFRDHLRGHNKSVEDAFKEVALAHEQQALHRASKDNPHGLSKADVGLDKVENRAPATSQDILDLTNLDRMMTPATLKQLIEDPRMTAGAVLNAVRTPRAITPTQDEIITSTQSVTLTADTYRHMYAREINGSVIRIPRDRREFEIYDVDNGALVWSDHGTTDTIVATTPLVRGASYRWRCRDVSIDGEPGQWSALARFTAPTSTVVPPSLTFEGGINSVVKYPKVVASPFVVEGDADYHTATTWRLFNLNANTPTWETNTTTDLTQIRLPGEYLFASGTYQLEVIYHTQSAGDATSGRVVFRTMDRFPHTPGPIERVWGDDTTGYYGEIPNGDFISADQLFLETGLSAGQATTWASTTPWLKLHVDGHVAYLPRYPLRYGVDEQDLNALGLMGNGKEVVLYNTIYRVRNLYGLTPNLPSADYALLGTTPSANPDLTANSEWNRIMGMVLDQLQVGNDQTQIGLTGTYRHNHVAEMNLDTNGHSVVRGDGTVTPGDTTALTYVNAVAPSAIDNAPQTVSWRPLILVLSADNT